MHENGGRWVGNNKVVELKKNKKIKKYKIKIISKREKILCVK